jgi:hypothetical protein
MSLTNKAAKIERTFEKLHAAATCMWSTDSEEYKTLQQLLYIVGEMRLCADLVKSDDRQTRVAAFDRWDDILEQVK